MASYTQDHVNAAYATERANGASDADLERIGKSLGVTDAQFNLASQAWGGAQAASAGPAPAPAPSAAPADRFTQQQYDGARTWADGKTFAEIGAEAQRLDLSADEVGRIFGNHGGTGQQVKDLTKYGTEGWSGWQGEAAKWSYDQDSEFGWSRMADPKKPPTTGINLSQLQGMTSWNVAPNETVRSQLQQIIADDSPLMQQARARAMQSANARGLLNSSMAMTAADAALYDAAMPIAQQDASTYARAGEFNANTANTFSRDNNAFVRDAYMADFNVQANEWAAQQQWDRDYRMLDRQQQLTLERDAIQNGYQSARDQFAAQSQMAIAQLDAASRAAAIQPDTSVARTQMQIDADERKTDRQVALDGRNTLNNLRNDGADRIFRIQTSDMSPEQKRESIDSVVSMSNRSMTNQAQYLGIDASSWLLTATPAPPAPAPTPTPATNGNAETP
jgi:hypothetical protein